MKKKHTITLLIIAVLNISAYLYTKINGITFIRFDFCLLIAAGFCIIAIIRLNFIKQKKIPDNSNGKNN